MRGSMPKTPVQVTSATRERLSKLKSSPRESYDKMINKLLALVPEGDDEGLYTPAFRSGLLRARLDVIEGHVRADEVVKR